MLDFSLLHISLKQLFKLVKLQNQSKEPSLFYLDIGENCDLYNVWHFIYITNTVLYNMYVYASTVLLYCKLLPRISVAGRLSAIARKLYFISRKICKS